MLSSVLTSFLRIEAWKKFKEYKDQTSRARRCSHRELRNAETPNVFLEERQIGYHIVGLGADKRAWQVFS